MAAAVDSKTTYLDRPRPLYFIGDSHSLAFSDRLYLHGGTERKLFIGRSGYINGLHARDVFAGGALHRPFLAMLAATGLVVGEGGTFEAYHRSRRTHWQRVADAEGRERSDPCIVLSCGTLDLVRILGEFQSELHGAGSAAVAARTIEDTFAPLASGLQALTALGFGRLAVLSVVPFARSDDLFSEYFLVRADATVRENVVALANEVLARLCGQYRVAFVDRSPDLCDGSTQRSDAFPDGIHIGPQAATATVHRVIAALGSGEQLSEPLDR